MSKKIGYEKFGYEKIKLRDIGPFGYRTDDNMRDEIFDYVYRHLRAEKFRLGELMKFIEHKLNNNSFSKPPTIMKQLEIAGFNQKTAYRIMACLVV